METSDRAHVDNGAGAHLAEVLELVLHAPECPQDVGLDHLLELLGALVFEERRVGGVSGIVERGVQATVDSDRVVDQCLDRLLALGNVAV